MTRIRGWWSVSLLRSNSGMRRRSTLTPSSWSTSYGPREPDGPDANVDAGSYTAAGAPLFFPTTIATVMPRARRSAIPISARTDMGHHQLGVSHEVAIAGLVDRRGAEQVGVEAGHQVRHGAPSRGVEASLARVLRRGLRLVNGDGLGLVEVADQRGEPVGQGFRVPPLTRKRLGL